MWIYVFGLIYFDGKWIYKSVVMYAAQAVVSCGREGKAKKNKNSKRWRNQKSGLKRPLDFSSGLVYNLINEELSDAKSDTLSGKMYYKNSILLSQGRDAIFYCAYLCR